MGSCDTLSGHLSILMYIYLNVDECCLTLSMHDYVIPENVVSESIMLCFIALKSTGSLWPITLVNLTIDSIHG